MPPTPFDPVNRHFDRVIVGRVAHLRVVPGEIIATVRVEAVAVGAKTPRTTELRWLTNPPCNLTSPTVKPGEDVAVYANLVSGVDRVEGWLALDNAAEIDARIVRAAPNLVRARRLALNKHGSGRPIPRGDPDSWVTDEDYPPKALREGMQGIVKLRASVDYRGKVVACRVFRSSGSTLLDDATCTTYMRRARFRPPVIPEEQTATFVHRWVIPPDYDRQR